MNKSTQHTGDESEQEKHVGQLPSALWDTACLKVPTVLHVCDLNILSSTKVNISFSCSLDK